MGSGAKSYMRKGFLIYEEMRKFLYDFAADPSEFTLYMRKKIFLFYQCIGLGSSLHFFQQKKTSVRICWENYENEVHM
jgi:hypothetical protein